MLRKIFISCNDFGSKRLGGYARGGLEEDEEE